MGPCAFSPIEPIIINRISRLPGIVWIFEFKVVCRGGAGKALRQIVDRGYAEKYRDGRRRIVLVGVDVDEDERNLVAFETADG